MEVFVYLKEFNTVSVLFRLILTMILGGIIGMEREKNGRPAGLRTRIIVCLGACMTALIGIFVKEVIADASDPMRISAQVISGIGFLGVGTILVKENDHITGLTTAAGLWTTAAVGIATGYGFYEGAVAATAVVLLTTAVLFKIENSAKSKSLRLYIELSDVKYVPVIREWMLENYKAKNFMVVKPKSGIEQNVGAEVMIPLERKAELGHYLKEVEARPEIVYALESSIRQQFSLWR